MCLTPRTTLPDSPGSGATKLILPPWPCLLPVVSDRFSLASTAALLGQKEIKVMASVVSGTSKEILKEVKKFRILPDDLRTFFPLRFLHSHQGKSCMGPQASCLFSSSCFPYSSDPSFPCSKTDSGFRLRTQSSLVPQPDPLGSGFIYFSTFTLLFLTSLHKPYAYGQSTYFTLNITLYVLLLRPLLMLFNPSGISPIFQVYFKSVSFLTRLVPSMPRVPSLTKVPLIPEVSSTRDREARHCLSSTSA